MAGTLPVAAGSAAATRLAAPARGRRLVAAGLAALAVVAAAAVLYAFLGQETPQAGPVGETATAVRDRLVVTITESGEIDAKRSTNVAIEVEGQSTIIWVIEEGTVVKQGDKLLELDSADLQEKLRSQEMQFKTAKAAFEKADKAYAIQESTRESLLSQADLAVKFALLDLRKYLGAELADRLIAAQGKLDLAALVRDPALGGEALQEKRKLESDISLAGEELSRATSKAEWTRTLKEKGYVTGSELEADELARKRTAVALEQAKTALELFLQYTFPKMCEKYYTDWLEAKREYERVDARTQSELDSARATRDTSKEAFLLEETRLKKVQDQLAKTTILAPAPGMVVYDTSTGRWDRPIVIEPGATVRHQQNVIKLPDMSEMSVKVKLHESVVKQAAEGALAYVTIDANPKERLTGRVTKVAVMPDRSQWWLNPGLKTYLTEITLDSTPPGLKPGMSAQVEVLVDTRENVLQVPVSAVFVDKGFQVVYVRTPAGPQVRRVEVGLSNDRAVEIVGGLDEGEEVYLFKPPGAPELQVSEAEMKARRELERKAAEARAAAAAAAAAGLENLSPERVKAMKEEFEKMTPEQREQAIKRLRDATGGEKKDSANGSENGGPPGRPAGTGGVMTPPRERRERGPRSAGPPGMPPGMRP